MAVWTAAGDRFIQSRVRDVDDSAVAAR